MPNNRPVVELENFNMTNNSNDHSAFDLQSHRPHWISLVLRQTYIVLRLRRWMLFRRWMDRIKAFRHILLICKDISPISWIKLLFFCKNTARRWLWHTFAIWILWISGLDCRFCGSLINLILVSILYRKNTNKDDILFHCKWLWILIINKATDTINGWWTFNALPK